MTPSPNVLLDAVRDVARLAGGVALRYFGASLAIETKADGSPVTVADRLAEESARDWIIEHFPADGIVGEEFPPYRPDATRRWFVDPLDGTKSFVRGVPLWGTLVAACEGETVLAGAAFFAALGEMLAAAPGEGCWWNDRRVHVSTVSDIAQATVLTTDERFSHHPERGEGWRRLAASARVSRSWGDCYGYLLVATGRAEVMVDPVVSAWDVAPLWPAIIEAGGRITDWNGTSSAFGGSAIATNAALAGTARRLLGAGS